MKQKPVYLDYNATTPVADFLIPQWEKWLKIWGNPSSVHQWGQSARSLLWTSKEHIARFMGCHPLELIATSGGSEANNMAIKGLYEKYASENPQKTDIIISAVEHPSVKESVNYLAKRYGMKIHTVPVSIEGVLDKNCYKSLLSDRSFLVSIMQANNETGHIFPIHSLAKMARQAGALFHCDMVQALGKLPLCLKNLAIDTASFSAHKCYALKGTGILYCRKGLSPGSLIHGGPQERRRRAGTENVLGMACLGAVAERGAEILQKFQSLKQLRDRLEESLKSQLSGVQIIGADNPRLYNTSALLIDGVNGETLLMNMDLKGYAFSVGSACHSGSLSPSSVLLAMGLSEESAKSVFRISLGLNTTIQEVNDFVKDLIITVNRIRSFSS